MFKFAMEYNDTSKAFDSRMQSVCNGSIAQLKTHLQMQPRVLLCESLQIVCTIRNFHCGLAIQD